MILVIKSLSYVATLITKFKHYIIFLYLVKSDLMQEICDIQELVPLFCAVGFKQQSIFTFTFCQKSLSYIHNLW
jgi:hypothetical protein